MDMPNNSSENLPEMSEELKKKFDEIKAKLDNFKKRILKEHKEIKGIALLPKRDNKTMPFPPGIPGKEEDDKNSINVFVVVDDSKVKKKDKLDFIENADRNIAKIGKEIDENLKSTTLTLVELKEQCYDGKYELLRMIAMGMVVYDPMDLLAAIRISEVHKVMVLRKFDKYIISYVAAGSLFRGDTKSNDIDVYVIVDDTDVKRMGRFELKDKLRSIIITQGYEAARITGVQKQFHIQTYILTDFWESMKDANPVIFTLLRDGVPLYDRGVFMPWKLLLKMGRVKPSPEAIDMQMDIGDKLLIRSRQKLLSVVGEDLYYAMLNPAQAALMMYGLNPPTPKETIELLREVFVKKEKLLEDKYVKSLEEIRAYYKDIEHGKVKEVTGSEIDRLLKGAQGYLDKLNSIFKSLEKKIDKKTFNELYNNVVKVTKDVLLEFDIKPGKDLKRSFKQLLKTGEVQQDWHDLLENILNAKGKKLSRPETQKIRREARSYINNIVELLQKKKGTVLVNNKLRIRYNKNRIGEVFLFDKLAFLVIDINAKQKEVQKAEISKDGSLKMIQASDLLEMEDYIVKNSAPKENAIKEKLLESLKNVFSADMEIILN